MTAAKAAFLALLVVLAAAGCGTVSIRQNGAIQSTPSSVARIAAGPPAHAAVILMENEEYGGIIGSSATPYINALARRYALATAMYAIRHPSLPNYLALAGGSTFGIDSDCTDCTIGARSLVDQLDRRGISCKGYIEDLPSPCFTGAGAGEYAKKHNPFFYYTDVTKHPKLCAHVVSLDQFVSDERAHALPRFIWITPNLCHDMHDCSPATGDRFHDRRRAGSPARRANGHPDRPLFASANNRGPARGAASTWRRMPLHALASAAAAIQTPMR